MRRGSAPQGMRGLAGDERELFEVLGWRASAAVFGPTPVAVAIRRCEEIREQVRDSPVAVALTLDPLGLLHAMTGDFELARRLIREGHAILDELGRLESAVSHHEALVEMLAGRPEVAEMRLRPGYEALERMGEQNLRATTAAHARAGRLRPGSALRRRTRYAASASASPRRRTSARRSCGAVCGRGSCARGGDMEEGETLAREAVRLAEPTDQLVMQADALLDLADVLEWAGKPAEAEAALRRALELYVRKGDIVSAARARSVLGAASDPQVRVR